MRILVTGAAGAIGAPLVSALRQRGEWVRAFDRQGGERGGEAGLVVRGEGEGEGEREGEREGTDFVIGDVADGAAVDAAVEGMDAIVHLAAVPDEAPFPTLVGPNVLGVFHVLDSARRHGAKRVILASSVQVATAAPGLRRTDTRLPNNHYAITKLFAEDLGEMYARRFGLEVIAARIGWMVRTPREAARIQELALTSWYTSRADVARFVHAALHAAFTGFAAAYVLGPAAAPHFDLEPSKELFGFVPEDEFPKGLPFEVPLIAPRA